MSEQPNDNVHRKFFIGRYGQKRYAADHTFYWDRQGLHMALAFWVVAIAIALFESLGGGLTGVIAAAAWLAIITWQFNVYETRESDDINDKAWIDIGAYMNGLAFGGPAESSGLRATHQESTGDMTV